MDINNCTEVYAVPGAGHIVDMIHPVTGLTLSYGSTEAEVLARHPGAVRMPWEAWRAEQVARQNTPIVWHPTTEEQYHDMLNVLPPAIMLSSGFLVGEPDDHSFETGAPRFRAYRQIGSSYQVASRPMTIREFRQAIA